jgi:hypothetical protein
MMSTAPQTIKQALSCLTKTELRILKHALALWWQRYSNDDFDCYVHVGDGMDTYDYQQYRNRKASEMYDDICEELAERGVL